MRGAILVIALCACGRVGFDQTSDGGSGSGSDAGTGSGSGSCSAGTDPACFSNVLSLTNSSSGSGGNSNLGFFTNDLAGTCGGASGPDYGVGFLILQTGTYEFTITADFDTVLYALDGMTCAGPQLACMDTPGTSGEVLTLALTQDQRIVIVVDSAAGCGGFTLNYRGL